MRKRRERKLTQKPQIQHLSQLARIELSQKEQKLFTSQLVEILELFKKIDAVPLNDIEPTYHSVVLTNVFRADKVEPSTADMILKNVPRMKGRYIKAPRMG